MCLDKIINQRRLHVKILTLFVDMMHLLLINGFSLKVEKNAHENITLVQHVKMSVECQMLSVHNYKL